MHAIVQRVKPKRRSREENERKEKEGCSSYTSYTLISSDKQKGKPRFVLIRGAHHVPRVSHDLVNRDLKYTEHCGF